MVYKMMDDNDIHFNDMMIINVSWSIPIPPQVYIPSRIVMEEIFLN